MKKYYKNIANTLQLKELDDLAAAEGKVAVGVSDSGSLYIYSREFRKVEKINRTDAMNYLGVTSEELDKIIDSKGECVLETIETPINPSVNQTDEVINLVQESEKEDPIGILTQSILELTQNQKRLENELEQVKSDLAAFKGSILLD